MATWRRTGWVDARVRPDLPHWLLAVADFAEQSTVTDLTRFAPTDGQGRASAVLLLFGPEHDVLVIRRASTMRAHAGQPAFPGGRMDDSDADAVAAALREANEETGLDPAGVEVFATLPDLWLPVSDSVVTPVLGYWAVPSPVAAMDAAEVASVHRIPIDDLVDPHNRCRIRHPSGYVGPAFLVDQMLVWGFTAAVLSTIFDAVGWARPWDEADVRDLPAEWTR